ncbi:ABC transporter ATP-binding protein [Mycoplasmopsis agassizii]|uniref:ABC transporter ATP-binding protein n=1 Tax=Mycoplasmopsis agassizii TaxID=33922 RepID=A0ABX4H593_9BACT|nr:ABC transporter ATP-binding protein [Mycoplasmopsis agassizii]PAF55064.1 ABC transporter ATP-binding protein [Mycoplasmopsis agassizii]SMC19062.1 ATP-binding cassette, subfamily B [Mycoplasmopsis agassizii]
MKNIFKYLRGNRLYFTLISIVFLGIQVALTLYQAELLRQIIAGTQTESASQLRIDTNAIGISFAVSFAGLISSVIANTFAILASTAFAKYLRDLYFKKTLSLSSNDLDYFSVASLTARATNDLKIFQDSFLQSVVFISRGTMYIIGSVVAGVLLNPEMTIILAIFLPIFAVVFIIPALKSKKYNANRLANLDKAQSILRENILGVRVIKSYNLYDKLEHRFDAHNIEIAYNAKRMSWIFAIIQPIAFGLINLAVIVIYIVGGFTSNVDGATAATRLDIIATIIPFTLIVFRASIGVFLIMNTINSVIRSAKSVDRIAEVLHYKSQQVWKNDGYLIKHGSVKISNLNFKYFEDAEYVLKNINLEVKENESVGIIGPTGSGKSTLANILIRAYDVKEGKVEIDNVDIADIKRESLSSNVAIAFQKPEIISGKIRDNVSLISRFDQIRDDKRKQKELDNEIWNALEIAQAKEFVDKLEDKLDSRVEQRGTNFSGGQKQRLAISRAVAQKAKITIFDDSTSALDKITEQKVQDAMKKKLNTTLIVIAQRINSVENMDKIVLLNNGEISAVGTHKQLLVNSSQYQNIARIQLGDTEVNRQLKLIQEGA